MEAGHTVFLHWFGDRLAFANGIGHFVVHAFENRVTSRVAGNIQCFQDRHTTSHQGAEGSRGAGQCVLFHQLPENGHLDRKLIPTHATGAEFSNQLDRQPDRDWDAGDEIPVVHAPG